MTWSASDVRRLAKALGLDPTPWHERQVMAVLRRWIVLRLSRRTGEPSPRRQNVYEEPGWILLTATIAAKVARCPAIAVTPHGLRMPAVEYVALADIELDGMRSEWMQQVMTAARSGGGMSRAAVARRERELREAVSVVARVRETPAYRRGIAYLGQEFAWCARMDAGFRAWASMEE